MKNITKVILSIFFASLLSTSIQAGELTVTGGATATWTQGGDKDGAQNTGHNVGVSNELAFGATGELDNGWKWNYVTELDGTSTITDDVQLTITTDMGTIGFFAHEGGLRTDVLGVGALGAGYDYASPMDFKPGYNVDGYGNIQYHTPAGLIPFGTSIKVGYVPNLSNTAVLSAKAAAATGAEDTGRNLTQVQISTAPIEGLSLKGDVAWTSGQTGVSGSGGTEQGVSGHINATYAMGPVKIGYMEGANQPAVANSEITYYENKSYGISFAVNESLTVSYNKDFSERNIRSGVADGVAAGTKAVVEAEQETIQVAYTIGGMTLGFSTADVSNSDYTSHNETINIASIAMSF